MKQLIKRIYDGAPRGKFLRDLRLNRKAYNYYTRHADTALPGGAAVKALVEGRPECQHPQCRNKTPWNPHGFFAKYCSSSCANKCTHTYRKQTLSEVKATGEALEKELYGKQTLAVSGKQIRQFNTFLRASKLSKKDGYAATLLSLYQHDRKLANVYANLRNKRKATRTKIMSGELVLPKCEVCSTPVLIDFYGGRHCSRTCAGANRKTQEKAVKTNRARYDADYASQTAKFQAKVKRTSMRKYGTAHHLQSSEVKSAIRKTMIAKYGVDNPSKVLEVHLRRLETLYSTKTVTLGEESVDVQGYEHRALLYLVKLFEPSDIRVSSDGSVPTISYDGTRTYFPDIYIASKNTIIEVKSDYTLCKSKREFEQNKRKALACVTAGYKFKMFVYGRTKRLKLPADWLYMSWKEVTSFLAVQSRPV